jgi:predicted transposase YbfD/YdcC
VTHDVAWLIERENRPKLKSIGAVINGGETRFYISSRNLSAEQLLTGSRLEWSVESMHYQLDVVFDEDRTTLHNENSQKTMNILRKTALNIVRTYRDRFAPKLNMTVVMRKASFDPDFLVRLLQLFAQTSPFVTN